MDQILMTYYSNNAKKLHNTVDKILLKFGGLSNKDLDDFYSLANEVFVDVLSRYDGSQPFDGFLYFCLSNKIKTEISIDEPINIDSEGNDLSLADILGTDNDAIFKSVEDDENKKILKKCIENLEDREKIIMKLRYGFDGKDELTQKEVADKLGISQSYISRLEKKVINDLKRDFSA